MGYFNKSTTDYTLDNKSVIMLKFRPIAPKPTGGEAVIRGMLQEKTNISTRNERAKRKYAVRVRGRRRQNNNQCKNRRRKSEPSKELENEDGPSENNMVTLQLLPESNENISSREVLHINLDDGDEKNRDDVLDDTMVGFGQQLGDRREIPETIEAAYSEGSAHGWRSRARVSESWVIIECFSDAIMEGLGLGFSDKEKLNNLHIDTNPGFVSDNSNNVVWVNEAYEKMVLGEENQEFASEFRVYLVIKEKNMPYFWTEFACRVRVEYNWNGRKCARTVPCDVWKMEFGGFAWRMDFKAALSLGL